MIVRIVNQKEVMHRADVQGVVITSVVDVEVVEDSGKSRIERHTFWTNWETGRLDHIDTIAI